MLDGKGSLMRRLAAVAVAAVGLAAFTATPVSAQDSLLDLPPLGFTADQLEGYPGDVVTGTVDVDDVARFCTTIEELQGNVSDSLGMVGAQSTTVDAWLGQGVPEGFDAEQQEIFADAVRTLGLGVLTMPDIANMLWEATHVFAFGDVETQEIIDASGNFDPVTGQGSIVVPNMEPGTYAFAAACVIIQSAGQLIDSGLTTGLNAFWDWVDESGIEIPEDRDPLDPEWQGFVEASAFEWAESLVDPRALGLELFCILQPDGTCPGAAPGGTAEEPSDAGTEPGAEPVQALEATPSFTG